jgi:YD repeat-containing protein
LSKHLVWQNQPAGAGSAAGIRTFTYDANGNPKTEVDWAGNTSSFTYDLARNLETSRTEAVGTPDVRTTSTQWHSNMPLPVAIASPKLMTTLTYDASGNLLTKAEQATTDANGAQGFAATKVGLVRQWTNTYNGFGQVVTAKGPRTDVNDTTTYAYDVSGNLLTITNAAGHVTTYSDYDAHGRPHRITAPNKVVVDIDYTPRGWVRSRKVSSQGVIQTTDYEYDGVGQLTKLYQPDGSYIAYTYDNAHQLTDIADCNGNSIHYTLDAMGNRLKEEVKDANGTLWRQATREFDVLSRLKKQTGAAQ